MAQNKIVIAPDTTTVTVSSVGLNGPAGADGTDAFPYTGSAIVSGSLEVTGETNITGSIYFTNGTADDSYYPLNNANYYRQSFIRNPSSFTITNNQHTDFTGSVSNAPILAGTVDFTDVRVSGSTSGDIYGILFCAIMV